MEELRKLLIEKSIYYFSNGHANKNDVESYNLKLELDSLAHILDVLGKNKL